LLKRIYKEVGCGGFGPGYGLIGLNDCALDDMGFDLVDGYLNRRAVFQDDPTGTWPNLMIPMFSWGGAIFSCCDFEQDPYPILLFDPTVLDDNEHLQNGFRLQAGSLFEFLYEWIQGSDFSPTDAGL
jgi:hypothetical protein